MTKKRTEVSERDFWKEFQKQADSLNATLKQNPRAALDSVDGLLKKFGFDVTFDLTLDDDDRGVLVLSPENDADAAQVIDRLVAAAPKIPGWTVFGRRQKKDLADALEIVREIFDVDLSSSKFKVDGSRDGLEIILLDPRASDWDDEDAGNLVLTFLNHAVGEQTVMEVVSRVGASAGTAKGKLMTPEKLVRFFEQF